jgi:hypothetical protein
MAGPAGQNMQRTQQRDKYQGQIDDLMRQMQFGQIQGMNPMQMAGLQQQMQQAQRGFGDWQQQQYAGQMGQLNRPPGAGSVGSGMPGGRPGQTQLQQNPYLELLLLNSLGMGGGQTKC